MDVKQAEISIGQYFHILRARRFLLIIMPLLSVALAAGYTVQLPKVYTAKTSINFDFQGGNLFFNESNVTRQGPYIQTQMDVIKSRVVAEKVVNSLNEKELENLLAAVAARRSPLDNLISSGRKSILGFFSTSGRVSVGVADTTSSVELTNHQRYPWLAGAARARLKAVPVYGSRFVWVEYTSTNPHIARIVANAYANTYIAVNIEMITEPAKRTKNWLGEQISVLREELEESQARLTAYQQSQGIVATNARMDTENRRLENLTRELIEAQSETRQSVEQLAQLDATLGRGNSPLTLSVIFENALVQRLSSDVRKLEAKRAEQSSKLGLNHPQYQRTLIELREANNDLEQAVKSVIVSIRNLVKLSKNREKSVELDFQKQKKLVLDFKYQHDQIIVLERDVTSAQTTYNTALMQQNQSGLRSLVDQTNANIVDVAKTPSAPSGPKIMKNLAIGVFVGFVFGLGIVILMELVDRRVRSKEDMDNLLGIPVLAILERC
ncbi:hypothetical protein MNBD_GAMMA16-1170 [hydrothermal vent metagenome]|uniref:Tyrosine kinase G-rich domain-containing protein n=1 Tax=hydrothermal vent metagenome TaxID=652676 RepID=A0A3B0ZMK2_9ZZZZ